MDLELTWKPVVSIQARFDASPFDTTSRNEITQEFRSLQVAFARALVYENDI